MGENINQSILLIKPIKGGKFLGMVRTNDKCRLAKFTRTGNAPGIARISRASIEGKMSFERTLDIFYAGIAHNTPLSTPVKYPKRPLKLRPAKLPTNFARKVADKFRHNIAKPQVKAKR